MERIPNEILDHVIDYLYDPYIPRCELHLNDVLQLNRVNRRWHALASRILARQAAAIRKAIKEAPTIFGGSKNCFESHKLESACAPLFLEFVITLPKACRPWATQGLSGPDLYLCTCHPTMPILWRMMKYSYGREEFKFDVFRAFAQDERLPRLVNFIEGCPLYDLVIGLENNDMAAIWCLLAYVFPQLRLRRVKHPDPSDPANICLTVEWVEDEDKDKQCVGVKHNHRVEVEKRRATRSASFEMVIGSFFC